MDLKEKAARRRESEPVFDLVGPVSLEAQQGGVHPGEIIAGNAADLFDRARMLFIDAGDDAVHLLASLGQADADRPAIDARAGVVEEADLDQFLDVIGNIRAEIIAARAQFARGQFLVADIVQEQSLHRVDVRAPATVEFILDDVQEPAMEPLDHCQRLEVQARYPKFRVGSNCNILRFDCVNHSTPVCSLPAAERFSGLLMSRTVTDAHEYEFKSQDESKVFRRW
jgi:hypothetical protein